MNAAFLLMTSAMLVGQPAGGDKKPAPPAAVAPAPVVSTGCGAGGCQDACGCDSYGHKLRDRLRGMFARKCDTCDTCKPAPVCHKPLFHKSCDTCATCDSCPKAWTWQKRCHEPACTTKCAPAPTCNTCTSSCGCGSHAFLDRLREAFRRKDCCDTCSTCGSAPVAAPPTKTEKIEAPKKMPDPKVPDKAPDKAPDKKPAQVRIDTPAAQIPAIPTAPTVEVTPAPSAVVPVPRVDAGRRDPF